MTTTDGPDISIFLNRPRAGAKKGNGRNQRFLTGLEVGLPQKCADYGAESLYKAAKSLGITIAIRNIDGEQWIARLS